MGEISVFLKKWIGNKLGLLNKSTYHINLFCDKFASHERAKTAVEIIDAFSSKKNA